MSVQAGETWKDWLTNLWQGGGIKGRINTACVRWGKLKSEYYARNGEFRNLSPEGKIMIAAALEGNPAGLRRVASCKNASQAINEKILLQEFSTKSPRSAFDIALEREEDMCGLSKQFQGRESAVHTYCRDAKQMTDMFISIAASAGKNIDADKNVQKVLNKRK